MMIGKLQNKIMNFYLAKEKWLQDKYDDTYEFISTCLLADICEWSDDDCKGIIHHILKLNDYRRTFGSCTCPHCIKYRDIQVDDSCRNCTYGKIYGYCGGNTNPWTYYTKKRYKMIIVPNHVIDKLREI